jgi:hypothetical protein
MAPTTRPKPTDATGVARDKALKANLDEVKRRENEITTIAATEARALETEVFDPKVASSEPVIVDEVISIGTDLADDSRIIRVIANIENMTYGYGNTYNFTAGVKYKVAVDLADYLDHLGYTYIA